MTKDMYTAVIILKEIIYIFLKYKYICIYVDVYHIRSLKEITCQTDQY